MKLFSNFDTQIKTKCIEENVQEYGEEKVVCLSRSGLFFFVKVVWPLIGFVLLDLALIFFFYYVFDYTYLRLIILIVLLVSSPFIFHLV